MIRFPHFPDTVEEALFSGSFPRLFDRGLDVADWFNSYVATYVERDVRTIGNISDLATFRRFLALCAGRSAQLLNNSSLAGDCGISQPTAKAWLAVLETGFLVHRLPAFSGNFRKRLIKMPKLHFLDTGLLGWVRAFENPSR